MHQKTYEDIRARAEQMFAGSRNRANSPPTLIGANRQILKIEENFALFWHSTKMCSVFVPLPSYVQVHP